MKYTFQEHQAKKLITGNDITEQVAVLKPIKPDVVNQLNESAKGKGKRKLVVQMEAIHVGRTANYTFYTEQGLKEGLDSWTHPYNKPVLTHHRAHGGEPIGRILRAEFTESTISGRKGLIFTCEITDPDAVEKVLDGRYQTVSIGATTDKVTCNICGTDRSKEWCEHWRGEEYEGQTCHFVIGTTMGREVSYVNVPSDEDAGNISVTIDEPEETDTKESDTMQIFQIAEGLMQSVNMPEINLYESASDDVKQLVDGLLTLEEGGQQSMDVDQNKLDEQQEKNNEINESAIQVELKEAQTTITRLEGELAEAQKTLATLTIEKTKADALVQEAEEEINRLTTENATLIEKAHKTLAEKVVDMKLSLRKSDVVGVAREEAVENHVKRTEESLNDAIQDLQAEMKNTTAVSGSVLNPGAEDADNNPNENNNEETMTVDEATSMFTKMFGRKRQ